jgi:VWFA-related protein
MMRVAQRSHPLPAATTERPASASLRLVTLLAVLSKYACAGLGRASRIHRPLSRFAAKPGRIAGLAALLPLFCLLTPVMAQELESTFKFEVTTNLIVINVEVADKDGKPVEGLAAQDFEIFEDKKRQQISVFEFQRLEGTGLAAAPAAATAAAGDAVQREITPSQPGQVRYRDRRLIVLFFDFSSMAPEEQIRARTAAEDFIAEKMDPADLVAIMSYSTELRVLQDFTGDRDRLSEVMNAFRIGETSDLAELAYAGEEESEETGAAFTADETEFNIFNTDQKLTALEDATRMLGSLPEKKALVYFSSGVGKTGTENQSQLRSTVNAAVKANVAFYPVDARGLVAEAPLGDASAAGTSGSGMYSGRSQRQRGSRFHDEQETLYTLAADTGGKALLDNNDLTLGIVQAQEGISSYYILGYYSTNPAEDGKYRRIQVKVGSVKKAKLDYRSGYFASKQFGQFTESDKERQLEEALLLGDPITDLNLALEINYFLRASDRYIVPVAVKIPGSEIETIQKKNRETTRLDFIGQVRGRRGIIMGNVRDHIEVKVSKETGRLAQRQLQYDTAFTLPPGRYSLKFLVRENQTGRMGTFETSFEVPDVSEDDKYLPVSSVVWANQREPLGAAVGAAEKKKKLIKDHPLVRDGEKLIPSITKVFRKDQNLFVYFEVYGAGLQEPAKTPSLAASVSFFRNGAKAFESGAVRLSESPDKKGKLLPVEFQIPLEELDSGRYTCQLNVVDEVGQKFAFRRTPLVLLP